MKGVGVVACGTLLMLLGACSSIETSDPEPADKPDALPPPSAAKPTAQPNGELKAPTGMRLVGIGGAAVSVPADWPSVSRVPCAGAAGKSVNFVFGDQRRCSGTAHRPAATALTVATLDSAYGRVQKQGVDVPLDTGLDVEVLTDTVCSAIPDLCHTAVAVPQANSLFLFQWRRKDEAFFRQVRGSLQLLPEGYTTVPYIKPGAPDANDLLLDAGLVPRLANPPWAPTALARFRRVSPPAGSVLPVGATVMVTLGG